MSKQRLTREALLMNIPSMYLPASNDNIFFFPKKKNNKTRIRLCVESSRERETQQQQLVVATTTRYLLWSINMLCTQRKKVRVVWESLVKKSHNHREREREERRPRSLPSLTSPTYITRRNLCSVFRKMRDLRERERERVADREEKMQSIRTTTALASSLIRSRL